LKGGGGGPQTKRKSVGVTLKMPIRGEWRSTSKGGTSRGVWHYKGFLNEKKLLTIKKSPFQKRRFGKGNVSKEEKCAGEKGSKKTRMSPSGRKNTRGGRKLERGKEYPSRKKVSRFSKYKPV